MSIFKNNKKPHQTEKPTKIFSDHIDPIDVYADHHRTIAEALGLDHGQAAVFHQLIIGSMYPVDSKILHAFIETPRFDARYADITKAQIEEYVKSNFEVVKFGDGVTISLKENEDSRLRNISSLTINKHFGENCQDEYVVDIVSGTEERNGLYHKIETLETRKYVSNPTKQDAFCVEIFHATCNEKQEGPFPNIYNKDAKDMDRRVEEVCRTVAGPFYMQAEPLLTQKGFNVSHARCLGANDVEVIVGSPIPGENTIFLDRKSLDIDMRKYGGLTRKILRDSTDSARKTAYETRPELFPDPTNSKGERE